MKSRFVFLSASLLIMMSSCMKSGSLCNEISFLGEWHEVMPVNKHIIQGIVLEKNGKASSVGMATLKYNGWQLLKNGDECSVVFSGESIGNRQTIRFSDTLDVISVNEDTLTLGKGGMYRIQYVKAAETGEKILGGNDASMGYTYSKVLDRKIRIFETGCRVLSATDPDATMAGYIVFPEDSSRLELFLPEETIVLDRRTRPDASYVWNIEDDDTYMVENRNDEWIVTRNGKVMYTTTGTDKAISAEFAGDNGDSLYITFFNNSGVPQMRYKDIYYVLYQYRTASGYGYRNAFADIRGKSSRLTLSLVENSGSIEFTEKK